MDEQALTIKKWQDFLSRLSPDVREIANTTTNVNTLAQVAGIEHDAAFDLLELRNNIDQTATESFEPSIVNSDKPTPALDANTGEIAGFAAGGAFLSLDYLKNRKYHKFKKQAEKYAREKAKQWEKNPDGKYSKSVDSAYRRALNEFYDRFLITNPDQARKWAKQYKDSRLQKAILKKEILEKPNDKRNKTPSAPAQKSADNPTGPRTRMEWMALAGKIMSNPKPQSNTDDWREKEAALRQIAMDPGKNTPIFKETYPTSPPSKPINYYPQPQPTNSPSPYSMARNRPWSNFRIPGRSFGRNSSAAGKNLAKEGVKKGGKKIAASLAANPYFWVALGIILAIVAVIIMLVLIIGAINQACKEPFRSLESAALSGFGTVAGLCLQENETPQIPGVTIYKAALGDAADGEISNGDSIEYEITLTIDPNVAGAPNPVELTVYDRPEFEYNSLEATGAYSMMDGDTIMWSLLNNPPESSNTYKFRIKMKPTVTNSLIENTAYVKDPGGRGASTNDYGDWDDTIPSIDQSDILAGQDAEPSNLTCGKKYTKIMDQIANNYNSFEGNRMKGTGTNFGDPVCSFSDAKLKLVIAKYENRPTYRDFWYDIARCESPGNGPNGWGKARDTWGHFQMRKADVLGKPYNPSSPGYDPGRGDLTWQNQVRDAIKRNKEVLNENFTYWETARCLCSTSKHKGKPYCSQITADPNTCNSVCPNF